MQTMGSTLYVKIKQACVEWKNISGKVTITSVSLLFLTVSKKSPKLKSSEPSGLINLELNGEHT